MSAENPIGDWPPNWCCQNVHKGQTYLPVAIYPTQFGVSVYKDGLEAFHCENPQHFSYESYPIYDESGSVLCVEHLIRVRVK